MLRQRLLAAAHGERCWISEGSEAELEEGTIRKTSSAYFRKWLAGVKGCRSEALIIKAAEPRAEPCMTLAVIGDEQEVEP